MQLQQFYVDKKTGQHKGATRHFREELTLFRLRMKKTEKGLHDINYKDRQEECNQGGFIHSLGDY
jgi:hypothetical protein